MSVLVNNEDIEPVDSSKTYFYEGCTIPDNIKHILSHITLHVQYHRNRFNSNVTTTKL